MNLKSNQKGFTIVELLIVIIVIAILAAISIAAYTNITARANTSTAEAAAKTVADVAQSFQGNYSSYPSNKAQFVSGTTGATGAPAPVSQLSNDQITFLVPTGPAAIADAQTAVAATSQGDPNTVVVVAHGSPTAGFTIVYKDFTNNTGKTRTVGDTSSSTLSYYAN